MTGETKTGGRTFQRARRAALGYGRRFSVFAGLFRSLWILVVWFPRVAIAAAPAYAVTATVPAYLARTVPTLATDRGRLFGYLAFEAVAFFLLVGFLAGPVTERLDGRKVGILSFVTSGSRSVLSTVALAAALGLGVAVGSVLAVLPGILVGLGGYFAIPAMAGEGLRPWAAVKRSLIVLLDATDVFVALLVLGLLGPFCQAILFGAVPGGLTAPGAADITTLEGLAREACYFIPFLLAAILPTVVWHELRKE